MNELFYLVVQGTITLIAFYLGAWVYHRGQTNRPLSPSIDLNKTEPEEQPNWDQV